MDAVKELMTKKWFWMILTLLMAVLIYHAPRFASSLPLI